MDIPEYHDEQRLAGDIKPKLGPVAGIYASPYLGSFRQRWQVSSHLYPGVLVGFVVVVQEASETLPQSYKNLNLQFGMNCIYLEAQASPATGYNAYIVQPPADAPCRDDRGNVTVPATHLALDVIRAPLPTGFTQDSMVPAARFLEDNVGRPVLGLPCLAEWCQIGVQGFTPSTESYCNWKTTDASHTWACGTHKEALVPSFFDEQLLEEKVGNDWQATTLRAAIVPQSNINQYAKSDFTDTPRHIANMYLKDDPGMNTSLYRHGARKGENKVELVNDIAGGAGWIYTVTAITNPTGTRPIPFRVLGPHKHYDATLPGTMRWRFTVRDPGIWGPCGQDCCDSDGIQ